MDTILSSEQRQQLMQTLARNLSVFRAKLNASQDDLAERLGVTRQTVSAIESGQRDMTWTVFLALILIFFRNQETKRLLVALEIYTPRLDTFLILKEESDSK